MEKKIEPIYPNSQFKTFCYIKSVITRPSIIVGDYSYYDDSEEGPESFEKHVTHHYDFMGDKLIIDDPDKIVLTNEKIGDGGANITYRFTDIYGNQYWTPVIEN